MATNKLSQDVARLVRSELAARQIDMTEYASAVGQPKTTVWRKVTGKSKMTVGDVEAFAAGLGWTLTELLLRVDAQAARDAEPAPTLAEHITRQLSPEAQEAVRRARAEKEAEEGKEQGPNG